MIDGPDRPRFVVFVSRADEGRALRQRYPDVEFAFASHAPFAADSFAFDPRDLEPLNAFFLAKHRERPFSGVLNRREKYVLPAIALARRLGVRPIAREGLVLRDKLLMRRALSGRDDAAFLLNGQDDVARVPARSFPGVLKPRFGFNSRSVVKVREASELTRALREHHAHYAALRRPDATAGDFIVEPFLEGTEHTVEALVIDGEIRLSILSDKAPMTRAFFVETGDIMPSQVAIATQETLLAASRDAVRALGFENGWAHIELMEHRGRATVVEVAARMGGGYHEELIDAAYGVDRMRLLIDLHLRPLSLEPLVARAVVVGRRVVTSGVRFVRPLRSVATLIERRQARLLYPRDDRQMARVVIGPPYGYKNTVFEFLVARPTASEALRDATAIERDTRLLAVPVPARLYLALQRRQRGATPLDG